MQATYDVIVVGVGTMGAAACRALAQRGCRVLGLEQFQIPHRLGSHHGGSRMIRQAYFEHPDYVRLLQAVYPLWHELEVEAAEELFARVGAIYVGRPDCELVAGSRRAAEAYGIEYEMLGSNDVAARFPALRCPSDWVGLFEPGAGYLRAEACVSALARVALRQGASLCGETKVVDWRATDDEVVVTTERETFRAARLIFCGGAWSSRLLGDLGLPLRVTRQVVHWVWPQAERPFHAECLPCWAIDPQPPGQYAGIYYGFPLSWDPPGVKLGWHAPGMEVSPDHVPREVSAGERDWLPEFSRQFMPQLGGQVLGTGTCLYTYSTDGHFIVDRHPQHHNVCFAAGFSGHGFKFSPVMGQALAELCLDGQSTLPIDFLSLRRWRSLADEPRLSG